MGDPVEALRNSPVEPAPAMGPVTNGGPPTSSLVRHVTILAMANALVVVLLGGLSAAPRPDDRILYVAFSPFDDRRYDEKRIVAAGGRTIGGTAWTFIYKVAFNGDHGLARLEAGGAVLVFAADRLSICSASRERA